MCGYKFLGDSYCFLLSVQSELNFIAEHRVELEIGILYKMLDSLDITVL